MVHETDKNWVAEGFGIKPEEVIGYNSGICYSKVWVTNRAAAEKVRDVVKHRHVNGGWFHGMPLGGITQYDGKFEVMV